MLVLVVTVFSFRAARHAVLLWYNLLYLLVSYDFYAFSVEDLFRFPNSSNPVACNQLAMRDRPPSNDFDVKAIKLLCENNLAGSLIYWMRNCP